MSIDNDQLFQNLDSIITIDFKQLKQTLTELYKGQKKHQDTILEILSVIYNRDREEEMYRRLGLLEGKTNAQNETINNLQNKIIEIETKAFSSEQGINGILDEFKKQNVQDRAQIDNFCTDLITLKEYMVKFDNFNDEYEMRQRIINDKSDKFSLDIEQANVEIKHLIEEAEFLRSSYDVLKRKNSIQPMIQVQTEEDKMSSVQRSLKHDLLPTLSDQPTRNMPLRNDYSAADSTLNNQLLVMDQRIFELEKIINPGQAQNGRISAASINTNEDAYHMEKESFKKKKESGLFLNIDHTDRKSFPSIDRQTRVNDDILQELYNRYTLLLDELNSYKSKILYFLQTEDNDQNPVFLIEKRSLNYKERISKLEEYQERQRDENQTSQAEVKNILGLIKGISDDIFLLNHTNKVQKETNEEVTAKLDHFDSLLIDNERIIKLANIYTDDCVQNFKKNLETQFSEITYKINRLDGSIDEQIEKLKRSKVNREELPELEAQISNRIEIDFIHVIFISQYIIQELVEFKDYSTKKMETLFQKSTMLLDKFNVVDNLTDDILNLETFINQLNQDIDSIFNDIEQLQQASQQAQSFSKEGALKPKPEVDLNHSSFSPERAQQRKLRQLQLKSIPGASNKDGSVSLNLSSGVQAKLKQLEDKLDEVYDKMKEKEFLNEFFTQQAVNDPNPIHVSDQHLQSTNSDGQHNSQGVPKQLIMEVMSIKTITGKQQMQLNKIQNQINMLESNKPKIDQDKILKMQKENYELLKKYIDEVNQYSSDLYQKLQVKLNLKADQDLVEKFKQNVEDKVLTDLHQKMDKIDHKRMQNALKKKIDQLEDKLVKGQKTNLNSSFGNDNDKGARQPLFTKNNNICISCNQSIGDGHKKAQSIGQGGGFKPSTVKQNKNIMKDLQQMAPKLGAGFSRILSKLDKPEIVDMLMNRVGSRADQQTGSLTERKIQPDETQNNSVFLNSTLFNNNNLNNNTTVIFSHQQNWATMNQSKSNSQMPQMMLQTQQNFNKQNLTNLALQNSKTTVGVRDQSVLNMRQAHLKKNRKVGSQGFTTERASMERQLLMVNSNHYQLKLPPVLQNEQANLN
ncbi:UNKNOWN [Stylonychia lemnae]|uniref:Uncharacterized protein n=1 Tax=Stylonychia lemnae TaxID=5949 RepID=A0A078ACS1_STYLE|nr:UNKNOWN [Stylonychia lemnae]|eukprot:CDW80055.1 UNKNOWN [Stylonychia lemnae]